MKKLLMICYYYPPITDVGSLRSIAFSKYLPEYGWEPTVLTVSNPSKSYCSIGNNRPPDGVRVYRAPSLFDSMALVHVLNGSYARLRWALNLPASSDFFGWLTRAWLPDLFAPWIPGALIAGIRAGRFRYDAIYVSCSPFSSAIIGAILKGRLALPLVLDFRDPMTNRIHQKSEGFFDLGRHHLERWVLGICDQLIVVSQETHERYIKTYPLLKGKINVLHNGFDDSFLTRQERPSRRTSRFTIMYSGNFYNDLIPPHPFFGALRKVIASGSVPEDRIVFRYVGGRDDWLEKHVAQYDLGKIFEKTGHLARSSLIECLNDADVVLLRNYKPCITTKLYEGLAMGKTFLATIEPGEVEQMIKKYSPNSVIAAPSDEEDIASAIGNLYLSWESGQIKDRVAEDYLAEHNWQTLTAKLALILDRMQ